MTDGLLRDKSTESESVMNKTYDIDDFRHTFLLVLFSFFKYFKWDLVTDFI